MRRGARVTEKEVQACWEEFWVLIVAPGGVLDVEQVKKELYDFRGLMDGAAKVYDHVTGGRISKVLTLPSVVIAVADDVVTETVEAAGEELAEQSGGVCAAWE